MHDPTIMKQRIDLLQTNSGRSVLAAFLYFSEGAPIGFIWWALPVLLRNEGADIITISSISSLLILPWMLKFLWAPLIDIFRSAKWGFKMWIAAAQILMALTLFPLISSDPSSAISLWITLLLIHSIAASLQDAAVDALIINTAIRTEKGIINAYMQAGMLGGRGLFGGLSLVVAANFGISTVIIALMISISISLLLLLFVKEPPLEVRKNFSGFRKNVAHAFSIKNTWIAIFFALTGAAAFESAGGLSGAFLTDHRISQQTIGYFFGLPVVIAMLAGGFVGGKISDIFPRKKSVAWFCTGIIIIVLLIAALHHFLLSPTPVVLLFAYGFLYFLIGAFTSASYALFMDVTDPRLGATQFSTYMAATNACESWTVWLSGIIVSTSGYSNAFILMCAVSFLGILILQKIRI